MIFEIAVCIIGFFIILAIARLIEAVLQFNTSYLIFWDRAWRQLLKSKGRVDVEKLLKEAEHNMETYSDHGKPSGDFFYVRFEGMRDACLRLLEEGTKGELQE